MRWHVVHAANEELEAGVEDAGSSSIELPAILSQEFQQVVMHV